MEKAYIDDWNRALLFLESAEVNLKRKDFSTAVNRQYFACESAVVAALKFKGITAPPDHKIIWGLSDILGNNARKLLRELYDLRLQADYGRASFIVVLNLETAEEYMRKVKAFIVMLEKEFGFCQKDI